MAGRGALVAARVRSVKLWALTRRPALTLALIAVLGLTTGSLAAFAPSERLQFLPVVAVTLVAWSVRLRDTDREIDAYRSPGRYDAALYVASTAVFLATTAATTATFAPHQLRPHHFVLWGALFSFGLLGVLTRFLPVPAAAGSVVLVHLTLFTVQYLFRPHGPWLALIAQSSPPLLAWPVSLATWVAGVALVGTARHRRRRGGSGRLS